jgi:polyferredoxin
MGSIITRLKTIRKQRLLTQASFLLALNLYMVRVPQVCFPALNCHSCPAAVFACPVGVIVNFCQLRLVPYITLGMLGLVGLVGGRIICGWVCPFGLLQDLLHRIPTRKYTLPQQLGWLKYVFLGGMVLLLPLAFTRWDFSYCNVCPAASLESAIPWAFLGVSSGHGFRFVLRMSILLIVLVSAIVASRSFCRLMCPLGAIFSVFNRFSLFRLNHRNDTCTECGRCRKECPVAIDPVRQMNTAECIRCTDCTAEGCLGLGTN